jgi:hypothetical protein
MLKETLIEIFERDLLKLRAEIEAYREDADIWLVPDGITNAAGNLCLHLEGNLNHFIGAVLGDTGYVRDRDTEFSARGLPREVLVTGIDNLIPIIRVTLENMSESSFYKTYPLEKHGQVVSVDYMLIHLVSHLSYHLGQINYHRRLVG